ncbi:prepilin-type N-terminal cleavage/methylation domain-containing protein [Acidovorax sp. JG5]|uniref:prepilin-type N-terminal cleavage/methylation domain-containing protein n=1 Tax=Acidovorax sp. JG5 TaxID=2822718 RepID=UPI001B32D38D|nr:prepilin-type N-terminal cleavage/methylation domain-containing protein [Acidovorax sp. JG5]MBP3981813.1 prepilin-type N-terminal cleavage/methylation domain-containing protein [Acidovorax sp. JG5]
MPTSLPRGFTLIELLVTLAILAMLLLMAAPLATDWVHGARTLQARGTLVQGFAQAKALALRNPCEAPNATGTHAASLEAKTDDATVTLNVLAQGGSGCTT